MSEASRTSQTQTASPVAAGPRQRAHLPAGTITSRTPTSLPTRQSPDTRLKAVQRRSPRVPSPPPLREGRDAAPLSRQSLSTRAGRPYATRPRNPLAAGWPERVEQTELPRLAGYRRGEPSPSTRVNRSAGLDPRHPRRPRVTVATAQIRPARHPFDAQGQHSTSAARL